MSTQMAPIYLTIQWKDLPVSARLIDQSSDQSNGTQAAGPSQKDSSNVRVTFPIPATTDDGKAVQLLLEAADDRYLASVTQDEAVHRSRNLVSLAIALARLSLSPLEANPMVTAFIDRLRSLDAVARIGCEVTGDYCSMGNVIGQVTARFDDPLRPRIAQSGSAIALAARWANLIAIVIHELCANAIRHGALTNLVGRVGVRWTLIRNDATDDELCLTWRELDGPTVSMPAKVGFGSRLLQDLIASNRRCKATLRLPPSGLVYTLSIRLMRHEWRE
ncbi:MULTISPECIES: hypothetical protein [unclassified Sphingomonas]|jgi:two-component sensor histidine kinase|uniref:hypothetical protein n=1 Tax=unclassified Sphingomonas TaxID=196159 RepID=UPI001E40852C|nr:MULTISPECIES: hypothetical protein [unclassified Sphingomonas]